MPVNKDFYTLAGSSGQSTGYEIDQSIRFNDDNSTYLKKDYGSDGSQTTFTLSGWFKLGILNGTAHCLFATGFINGSAADFTLYFSGNQLYFYGGYNGGTPANKLETTQLFRDHSAWYHITFVADTTNAVSNQRLRLYVNGNRVTAFDTETYPTQNHTLVWGDATYSHVIGATGDDSAGSLNSQTPRYHYDGYMAELHYLDGYAYGPEYFGEFDDYGIWRPIQYTGSYGSNGFKIDGRDSSDLGDDESGNGNDFTTSGFATTDKRNDSPTNNHATWNPLVNSTPAYANGNIDVAFQPASSTKWAKAVMNFTLPNTGTWYWEGQEFNNVINPATALGIVDSDVELLSDKGLYNRFSTPMSTFTGIVVYSGPGQSLATYEWKNGSATSTSGAVILTTSRLGFLWEPENSRFTIYDDGSQYQQFTSINAGNYVFGVNQATGTNLYFRLFVEADDWTQTPTGVSSLNALNTKNIGS